MGIQRIGRVLILTIAILAVATPLSAATFYILEDYYNLLYIPYRGDVTPFATTRDTSLLQYNVTKYEPFMPRLYADDEFENTRDIEVNLDGQLELGMVYGKDFALGNSTSTGAGTAGIADGFGYDFISRILFTASVGNRLFIEFDYDSERKVEELGGDRNTYSVTYKGKDDQFLKEVNVGNKELAIKDSRYLRIDEGSADSFAVKGNAGRNKLHMEGLFRFNDALSGTKEFTGSRNSIEYGALDVEYVRHQFFIIPDTGIDESTLQVYKTATGSVDTTVDGKNYVLLTRGRAYTYDNTRGRIYLLDAILSDEELIVYYEKGGSSVGDGALGQDAIIDEFGVRDDFSISGYSQYFSAPQPPEGKTYLYLQKNSFNSYWELRNGYFLDEYEGETLFDVQVELRATANKGVNRNYDSLLNNFEVDTSAGVLFFNFEDSVGFYPRPFPGPEPYPVYNPFDPSNPVYGGIGDSLPENSINTLLISYSYNTDIYFLDFNLIPGSVFIYQNGVLLDQKNYDVDYEFGMLAFEPGLIKSSDKIVVTYRYTGFGSGEQGVMTALGFYYDNGPFYAQNLTAYESGLKGREAPEVGAENIASLINATSMNVNLGASDDEEQGLYALFDGEFAFSQTNNNVYGSAIIADMERDDFTIDLSMYDSDWMVATKPTLLPLSLSTRGDILFKNYWEKKAIGSDELRTLSWDIPADQVFSYSDKAGPYNTGDKPTGGADVSLVMEYDFVAGSSDPYASIVIPLHGANYSAYERLNLVLEGVDVAGDSVQLYVELLQEYNENLNPNGPPLLDGEETINDEGFQITPEDGNPTVIGTDREGLSNGTIESEDLNKNRLLDTNDVGLLIPGNTDDYIQQLSTGNSGWKYISVDILTLVENNPEIFQSAAALRLSITTLNPTPAEDATGKVVVNRIYFSGTSMVNESKDFLNMSEVSVDEDPQVRENALSLSYPDIYEELHGDASYRNRNDLIEKLLKVNFDPTDVTPDPELSQGEEAKLARRFALPADISFYSDYTMFLYLPQSESVPSNMDFTLSFVSSQGERMQTVIPGSQISQDDLWYRIDVHLQPPYTVKLNDQDVGSLAKTGDLRILNRLAEVQFGFYANGGDVTQPLEIWLDEWFVHDSKGYFDTALYTEGTFGYRGDVVSVSDFPILGNPSLLLGFEHLEGTFYKNNDERSDRLFTGLDMDLLKVLGTEVYLSRENVTTIRNEEDLPGDLNTDDYRTQQSHALELSFENAYIPSLRHSYDRYVTNVKDIDLNPTDYELSNQTAYDETLIFTEWVDFPFGLSQAYSFTRFWLYNDTYETTPSQSLDPTHMEDAAVDQQDRLDLSFDWNSNYVAGYYLRNKQFNGLSVPDATSWGSAYASRLGTLFKPVGQTIENGTLASTTDGYGVDLSIPLLNVVGFSLIYDTDYSQKNFTLDGAYRDTVYTHDFEMAVPFFFLGNDRVEVTPLMRREFRGDYNTVSESITRRDIYQQSYRYMFMLPFYYMHPGGRSNDYKAVNIFRVDPGISGSTINSLLNNYILDVAFGYDTWYVPSSVNFSIGGETRREGEAYRQSRGWGAALQYNVPLSNAGDYFKNNMFLNIEYEGDRQFDTKLQNNGISLTAEYNSLRTEFQGLKIYDQIGYTRSRQHIGDPDYSLFPDVPDTDQSIAQVVPSDTVANQFKMTYLWEVFPKRKMRLLKRDSDFKSTIKNEEILTIDNSYTITDREQAESFSNLPFRLTLEHETEYNIIDNLTFYAFARLQFGVEEKVAPNYISGNTLTSLGFDLGITIEIIF